MINRRLTRYLSFSAFILVFALALFFSTGAGVLKPQPVPDQPVFDNCTSILVGRLASLDGSTMTSHSCDSNTDRTWMTMVPHRRYPAGAKAKIYFELQ